MYEIYRKWLLNTGWTFVVNHEGYDYFCKGSLVVNFRVNGEFFNMVNRATNESCSSYVGIHMMAAWEDRLTRVAA